MSATNVQMPGPAATPPANPRRIAWARRRRAASGYWAIYRRNAQGMVGLVVLAVFIALALTAPLLIDEREIQVAEATGSVYERPTSDHLLGTDKFGRDVLSMLIYGTRISLFVGLTATMGSMFLGGLVGISSGYFGRWPDTLLNALTNWFLVIPWIPLALVLISLKIFGRGLSSIIIVIAITSWAGTARLVRAQALSVKERTYVERAKALGAGNWHMITRHILPNVFPVLFSNLVLTVSLSILSETTLAILGLGDPNSISWGVMIGESFDEGALTAGIWWWLIPPGIALVFVTLSFTMCGYALDEILNPRLRER
ncbi:MAG: ABC transporter permease [Actinomycetota bacterium]